ncbi:MAG: protein kinase [Myxococcota bacterium]
MAAGSADGGDALDKTMPAVVVGGVPQTGDIEPVPLPESLMEASSSSTTLQYKDFKTGLIVKDWRLEEPLGEGGGGKVFACTHTETERRGAFKVVNLRDGPQLGVQLSKLTFEVRTFNQKLHPNVIAVLDANLRKRPMWMVTEFIPGRPLEAELDAHPEGLDLDVALHYAEQIGDGLATVHALGVIHRDLKPANILVRTDTMQPVIIDFGESRFRQAKTHVGTGKVYGSVGYAPPEMLSPDWSAVADGRIDVFQLGVILYEMVSAQGSPFRIGTRSMMESVIATVRSEPPSLEARVGPEVWAIIWRALRKRPEERFPTMADMVAAIREERARRGFAQDANPTAPLPSQTAPSLSAPTTPSPASWAHAPTYAPDAGSVRSSSAAHAMDVVAATSQAVHAGTPPTASPSTNNRTVLLAGISVVLLLGLLGVVGFVELNGNRDDDVRQGDDAARAAASQQEAAAELDPPRVETDDGDAPSLAEKEESPNSSSAPSPNDSLSADAPSTAAAPTPPPPLPAAPAPAQRIRRTSRPASPPPSPPPPKKKKYVPDF